MREKKEEAEETTKEVKEESDKAVKEAKKNSGINMSYQSKKRGRPRPSGPSGPSQEANATSDRLVARLPNKDMQV